MITSSIVSVIGRSGGIRRRDFPRNEACGGCLACESGYRDRHPQYGQINRVGVTESTYPVVTLRSISEGHDTLARRAKAHYEPRRDCIRRYDAVLHRQRSFSKRTSMVESWGSTRP